MYFTRPHRKRRYHPRLSKYKNDVSHLNQLYKVLDKLVPPPSDPACQDDDIAVGKFYATVLIQVMVSLMYIVFQ